MLASAFCYFWLVLVQAEVQLMQICFFGWGGGGGVTGNLFILIKQEQMF